MEGSWDGIAGCVVHVAVQVKKLLTAGYEAKGHTRYIFGGAEPPKLDNKGGWSPLAPPPPPPPRSAATAQNQPGRL